MDEHVDLLPAGTRVSVKTCEAWPAFGAIVEPFYNDENGHLIGYRVLMERSDRIASVLAKNVRPVEE